MSFKKFKHFQIIFRKTHNKKKSDTDNISGCIVLLWFPFNDVYLFMLLA